MEEQFIKACSDGVIPGVVLFAESRSGKLIVPYLDMYLLVSLLRWLDAESNTIQASSSTRIRLVHCLLKMSAQRYPWERAL